MVCHTDVTDPALLYNVLLYMYMCMHMVVHILKLHSLHVHLGDVRVSFVTLAALHHNTAAVLGKLVRHFVRVVLLCYCQSLASSDLIAGLCVDVLICRL